ncbi:MAG: PilZ domain-containing protein [Desulfobacterales bacterium]|nr:PilZ domain-containing protein [Desulfobacterales bacterium]
MERRKHKRYKAPNGAFVVLLLEPHFAKLGQIIDIGRGGLAFRYTGRQEWSAGSSELGILFHEQKFHLDRVPFKTVSDFEMARKTAHSPVAIRRCGVRFVGLTHEQKFELEHFIRNYTSGEVEKISRNLCDS